MADILKKISPSSIQTYPLIPLRNVVPFPYGEINLVFGRPKTSLAINIAFREQKKVVLVAQKDPRVQDPGKNDIYQVGVLCQVEQVVQVDGSSHAIVKGIKRVIIVGLETNKSFYQARVIDSPDIADEDESTKMAIAHLVKEAKKAFSLGKLFDPFLMIRMASGISLPELISQISISLDLPVAEKQKILETVSLKKKLKMVTKALLEEIKVLELEKKIDRKTQSKFEKGMKRAVLEEKKKTIDRELKSLGIASDSDDHLAELEKKIKSAKMPKKVKKKVRGELKRLRRIPPIAPEASYIMGYLETLVSLPWQENGQADIKIKQAEKILNNDHYGLKKVKERILEYLAVMQLLKKHRTKKAGNGSPNILYFVGPPGVGKTSIGKSIARALGRKFVRVSLGGIRDEAEIRGHRRTYVGAMPGRIIQGVRNAGTKNPVFMLDEVDKLGTDFRGDPSAALLEALDPEQNKNFSDHYLEVPYDLSTVFFILTGNVLDTVPPALRDRLEIIRFSGYTEEEKYQIAKKFLLPRQIKANGLFGSKVEFEERALREIISGYTWEAGVRELERMIAKVCRKLARKVAEKKRVNLKITKSRVSRLLGPKKINRPVKERKNEAGVVTGLAWTQAGGEAMPVEVAFMPGVGRMYLTGKLGLVMKESCKAAISYIRSHWKELGVPKNFTKNQDIHIHVPEGAVSKDGPSAGVAISSALFSALTGRKARASVGMTGEITLRGKVLEIGGVKEKVLAAHRAGVKTVVLPKTNKKDLIKISPKVKNGLKFVFVDNLKDVFKTAIV